MQNSLLKLFEHKCVLEVCVHIHPIMIKIHPVFFFFLIPILKSPFSNQAVLRFLSEWRSSVQATPTIVDWHGRLTLDPLWVSWENWVSCKQSDRHCVDSGAGEDKVSQIKRLKCFVVGCNNELGLGDVYQIGIGRCLQWNIVMDDDIGGRV